jgi:streptogramin lyase
LFFGYPGAIKYLNDKIYYKAADSGTIKVYNLLTDTWESDIVTNPTFQGEGMNIDASGNFWLYDGALANAIGKYDSSGNVITTYLKPSVLNTESEGIAWDSDRNVWVTVDKQTLTVDVNKLVLANLDA